MLKLPTTKDENPRTRKGGDFHINAHGLRPTMNHESFDMAMLINSFQIKTSNNMIESYLYWIEPHGIHQSMNLQEF